MKTKRILNLIQSAGFVFLLLLAFPVAAYAHNCHVYRVYNTSNGEHLYTSNYAEACDLILNRNWSDEGIGWESSDTGTPVYRLHHPHSADHIYTTDKNEVNVLTSRHGWVADNNGQPLFNSGGSVPVYRLYNSSTGKHHLTLDQNECRALASQGWKEEGVAFHADGTGNPTPVTHHDAATCPYGADCPAHHDGSHCVYGSSCPVHHDSGQCPYGSNCLSHHGSASNNSESYHHSGGHHSGGHH